jgi:hypothetical protein
VAELLGPGFERTVAGHLIMLDRLSRGDETGIEGRAVGIVLHHSLAFLQNAEDCVAGLVAGRLADHLEDVAQALDMAFGLGAMSLEGLLEFGRLCRLRHLRQRLQDLLLGIIDVLEHVIEHVVEGFGFGRHGSAPGV